MTYLKLLETEREALEALEISLRETQEHYPEMETIMIYPEGQILLLGQPGKMWDSRWMVSPEWTGPVSQMLESGLIDPYKPTVFTAQYMLRRIEAIDNESVEHTQFSLSCTINGCEYDAMGCNVLNTNIKRDSDGKPWTIEDFLESAVNGLEVKQSAYVRIEIRSED